MNRRSWIILVFLLLLVLIALSSVSLIRREWVNARRLSVYEEMLDIQTAVLKYRAKHEGQIPPALTALPPEFLAPEMLNPPVRRAWLSRSIIVPEHPYSMRTNADGFEITCQFFGNGYTQLVLNGATREVQVE